MFHVIFPDRCWLVYVSTASVYGDVVGGVEFE